MQTYMSVMTVTKYRKENHVLVMLVEELDLPMNIIDALREQGFIELHPPQADSLPIALEGKNLVVAIPTASGKSLIGYITALKKVIVEGKKVLYIVPLKALAAEKKEDFDRFSYLGFKVSLSTGDLDSDDRWLNDADIVVATSEKADSLMRHGSTWMDNVGLVIADEIHMIHDPGRGPTLEVSLTKMKRKSNNIQIIALSATISNSRDLALWLDAELVRSDWRPIDLKEGVFLNNTISFKNGDEVSIQPRDEDPWSLAADMIESGGQCIIFVNSRRSTEALAVRYSPSLKKFAGLELLPEEIGILEGDSESTALGKKLAKCVESGIAFHHAGLTYQQRQFIEKNFKNGRIKCIVATPTLAAGINLPARRVIIRDTTRFESGYGNSPVPVMEIKQMCGRAGRPGYDPYGEAILIAKSDNDFDHLMQDYLECESENITSKLGNEKTLRSHILGLIATESVRTIEDIIDFLRDSFYGSCSELYGVEHAIENVVDFLSENGMIRYVDDESFEPLPLGKRVSDLYIDPESAMILKNAIDRMKESTDPLLILHAVASTPDVMGLYPKKRDSEQLRSLFEIHEGNFLTDEIDEDNEYDYEYFLSNLKVALLADDWINEINEDTITDSMGIGPGDIRSRIDSMEWLLYSMIEIAVLTRPEIVKKLRPLLTRIKYGVRPELLELVSLKGVGRARARTLYDNGIQSKDSIISADIHSIANLPRIGMSLAKSLKEQTGSYVEYSELPDLPEEKVSEPVKPKEKKKDASEGPKQSKLFDF